MRGMQGTVQGTISVLAAVYGGSSAQLTAFRERIKPGQGGREDLQQSRYERRVVEDAEAALGAALADAEAGFIGQVSVRAKGEILGNFAALARAALDTRDADADRVAAVLVTAALEETLKQIGEANGVDVYNRDMRGVIQKLKDAGVLAGAQSGIAFGFAKFRDHAFHGQFTEIERPTTEAALAFLEGLLAQRLS